MSYDPSEQDALMEEFAAQLRLCTGDGGAKRAAGVKPPWYEDNSHMGAVFSHLTKYFRGERVDPDSGAHPLAHAAWRLLAIACTDVRTNAADSLAMRHMKARDCLVCEAGGLHYLEERTNREDGVSYSDPLD